MKDPLCPGPPSLAGAPWLTRRETAAVLAALEADGGSARIVGWAVRNALIGEPVKDIDIATTALPGEVMRLAVEAGLKAVPTGIEHGTVTVVAHHTPFEVTTLRRDIETFGRHARVTFTTDWAEDARRRDFTINALYCDAGGTIHDPLCGYVDVAQRRVRFIGDPHDRIREDFLRILRFFRFTAEYAGGRPDAAGLAASRELRAGLDQLSGERIRQELLRLLAAPFAGQSLEAMHAAGILEHVLPQGAGSRPSEADGLAALRRLAQIETTLGHAPDPIRRLAALAVAGPGGALDLRERLRLSNGEYERLARMGLSDRAFDPASSEAEAKAFLYRHGTEAFTDGALIAWARSGNGAKDALRRKRAELPARWAAPELPIRGADVLALGVPPGPTVGRVVSEVEALWIEAGFPDDPARIARELARRVKVINS